MFKLNTQELSTIQGGDVALVALPNATSIPMTPIFSSVKDAVAFMRDNNLTGLVRPEIL